MNVASLSKVHAVDCLQMMAVSDVIDFSALRACRPVSRMFDLYHSTFDTSPKESKVVPIIVLCT